MKRTGSSWGTVVRAVASDTRGRKFESSHHLFYVLWTVLKKRKENVDRVLHMKSNDYSLRTKYKVFWIDHKKWINRSTDEQTVDCSERRDKSRVEVHFNGLLFRRLIKYLIVLKFDRRWSRFWSILKDVGSQRVDDLSDRFSGYRLGSHHIGR